MSTTNNQHNMRIGLFLAAFFLFAFSSFPALSQQTGIDVDKEARKIFTAVMSPYCPGLMLADCGSSAAAELRDNIKAQLRQGVPPREIMDQLVDTFGDNILAMPKGEGMGLVAWIGPIGALLASLLIISWWVRERKRETPEVAAVVAPRETSKSADKKQDLREKMEEELKMFD